MPDDALREGRTDPRKRLDFTAAGLIEVNDRRRFRRGDPRFPGALSPGDAADRVDSLDLALERRSIGDRYIDRPGAPEPNSAS